MSKLSALCFLVSIVFVPTFAQATELEKQTKRYPVAKNVDLIANKENTCVMEKPTPIKDHNDRLCFSISKSNDFSNQEVQKSIEKIFGQEDYKRGNVWLHTPKFIIGHIEDSQGNVSYMDGNRLLRSHHISVNDTGTEVLSICTTLSSTVKDIEKITFKTLNNFTALEIFWTEFY